ncbi:MAG: helix-turn-helix transcriptional regulator [bacterium]|nr:helix-turn-helix transcriptional regulator [bacterium]
MMTQDEYVEKRRQRNAAFGKLYKQEVTALRLTTVLAEQRMRLGLSQSELARRVGTPQSQISRVENGVRTPNLETLWRWAYALGIEIILQPEGHFEIRAA